MHEADIPMAEAMQQQYNLFGIRATAEAFPIEPLTLSSIHPFTIIHTPGHTPGSICLYSPSLQGGDGVGFLLSGDTLFHMGYGRTDLPGGNMGQLITSLEHLFELPADTRVFPGHGDFTTIGAEKRY
jgi:glyoxylase-like metal-dependent hydrolase (beta-lactamase superfamily II)